MDCINSFDIRLEKDVFYPGEQLNGVVLIESIAPIKLRGIRVFLRGRARVQWKMLKSGESRTLKDDQYLLDEKALLWGRDRHHQLEMEQLEEQDPTQILPRGVHELAFSFGLPTSQVPCSLETKAGTIRYYVKVIVDVPYASSPQGIKYFTLIGPHLDCMEDKYLSPLSAQDHKVRCQGCCRRGVVALRAVLERSAYCCGEQLRLRLQLENRQDCPAQLCVRLTQHLEYRIDRGGGAPADTKTGSIQRHWPLTIPSPSLPPFFQFSQRHSSGVPPRFLSIANCELSRPRSRPFDFPSSHPPWSASVGSSSSITSSGSVWTRAKGCPVAAHAPPPLSLPSPAPPPPPPRNAWKWTFPSQLPLFLSALRIANCTAWPMFYFFEDFCAEHVETGKYISPEFRLGHVWDGRMTEDGEAIEDVVLYRPVYVRVLDRDQQQQQHGIKGAAPSNNHPPPARTVPPPAHQQNLHKNELPNGASRTEPRTESVPSMTTASAFSR